MRRWFIALLVAVTLLNASGCSWYDAFCQRFAYNAANPERLAEKKRQDVTQMAEPD